MNTTPQLFWTWFEQHHKAYLFLNEVDADKAEELAENIREQLQQYCSGLSFEIGEAPDGSPELIISAEGERAYFPQVENLIAAAPRLCDWTFTAFVPPQGTDFEIDCEDIALDPKAIWFEPLEYRYNPSAIGIKVCTPNYESMKHSQWLRPAVYKMLDIILGERVFALDLHYVAIGGLCEEPDEEGLIPLSELPDYVNRKKAKYLITTQRQE